MITSASPPATTWSMISAWCPRKAERPKTSRSTSSGVRPMGAASVMGDRRVDLCVASVGARELFAHDPPQRLLQRGLVHMLAQRQIDQGLVAAARPPMNLAAEVIEDVVVQPDRDPRFAALRRQDGAASGFGEI